MKSNFILSRRKLLCHGMAGTSLLAAPYARAESRDFPSEPITIVVPFPPGGSTDLLARQIGKTLSTALQCGVIVLNRGGAGGIIGTNFVAHAKPDGHTLLFGVTGTNAISRALYAELPFDPLRDFIPLSLVVSAPLVLVVNPDTGIHTVADYVAAARRNPGSMTYGSPGNGTSMHLTGAMFAQAGGLHLTHIPYHGSASAMQAVISNQIMSMFGDIAITAPQIRAGKLRPLAVTALTRDALYPDLPTMAECGYPAFESLSWQAMFAPSGVPASLITLLSREIVAAVRAPDLAEFLAVRGLDIEGKDAAASAAFIRTDTQKWADVISQTGLSIQ
ncbi:Bug family tripartite tricarboxylate transporter substrate binding protein [Acetobacter tropicalis]|uniref:Tripartite tricarboxylate transporter substrate binding protein n=1 Tax=Acetobacter tropicalis TaxID=104102 RepID=A0A252A797_9PROT|nr:tripartite tricarboxylate transporter substrate binding protein [Acetobacter tropicalis]OUI85407.1 hypothetical protein HC62_11175 [Acetobacter tropicalis]